MELYLIKACYKLALKRAFSIIVNDQIKTIKEREKENGNSTIRRQDNIGIGEWRGSHLRKTAQKHLEAVNKDFSKEGHAQIRDYIVRLIDE